MYFVTHQVSVVFLSINSYIKVCASTQRGGPGRRRQGDRIQLCFLQFRSKAGGKEGEVNDVGALGKVDRAC